MNYAIFGPFNLYEARAISTSDPMECTPFEWGYQTHLESVGASCLDFGGIKREVGCTSHHFGGKLSTIIYHDSTMVLCQIDYGKNSGSLTGIYVCSEDVSSIFSTGFKKLIDKKLNPKSELNRTLNERREKLKQMVESAQNQNVPHIQKIKQSGILNPSYMYAENLRCLRAKSTPKCISKSELTQFIEDFCIPNLFGRNTHVGMVLNYFGLPTHYLVEPSIKEHLEFGKKHLSAAQYEWFKKDLRENTERLFGTE